MDFVLDLTVLNTERIFVFGELKGNYASFINILYDQKFTWRDTLVTTGNFVDYDEEKSLDLTYFLKNNKNTYSVKGKNEFNLLTTENPPIWYKDEETKNDVKEFLEELPVIIKVANNTFVVNAGVEPGKRMPEQNPEVFYSIGDYCPDSRFYQFENPDKKSWYEYEFIEDGCLTKFIFGGKGFSEEKVNSGYAIGRNGDEKLKCLILNNKTDDFVLVQDF